VILLEFAKPTKHLFWKYAGSFGHFENISIVEEEEEDTYIAEIYDTDNLAMDDYVESCDNIESGYEYLEPHDTNFFITNRYDKKDINENEEMDKDLYYSKGSPDTEESYDEDDALYNRDFYGEYIETLSEIEGSSSEEEVVIRRKKQKKNREWFDMYAEDEFFDPTTISSFKSKTLRVNYVQDGEAKSRFLSLDNIYPIANPYDDELIQISGHRNGTTGRTFMCTGRNIGMAIYSLYSNAPKPLV
jgi:hypothetical protein